MLYSYSPEEEKKRLFLIFLSDAKNGNVSYSNEVKKVLGEAIALCKGLKTFYNIDRNYFEIITGLVEYNREFYQNLDLANLNPKLYDDIIDQIQNLKTFEYA